MISVIFKSFKGYKWSVAVLVFLGLISSASAGLGIGAIIPLFSLILGRRDEIGGTAGQFFLKAFEYLPVPLRLSSLLAGIITLFILRAVFLFVFTYIRSRVHYDYKHRLLQEFFSKLLGARLSFFSRHKVGHTSVILQQAIDRSSYPLEHLGQAILALSGVLVYAIFALFISWPLTLFAISVGALIFFVLRIAASLAWRAGRELALQEKMSSQYIVEHTVGIKTVKSLAAEERVFSIASQIFSALRAFELKKAILRAFNKVAMEPITVIFISAAFAFTYKSIGFDFGAFAATMVLVQRLFLNFQLTQSAFHSLYEDIPYVEQIEKFREELDKSYELLPGEGLEPFKFEKVLEFREVELNFDGRSAVLGGVSFSIRKGEMVGLVGPSGAGKTSVADLIARFLAPDKGTILLDGKDINHFNLKEWRRRIGYVPQEPFLLNDTIEANIRFYDETLGLDAIISAAKKANIYEFIQSLPEGFRTVVGERGTALSGGERQRIVLARVLVRNPEFLILDEATSALDSESEFAIKKALEGLRGKITILIIAHRLATIMDVDRILVLQEGRIVEEGRPEELLRNQGSYFYRMSHLLKLKEEPAFI